MEKLTKAYEDAFLVFDKDNDGRITKEELATVIRSLEPNYSDKDLEGMIKQVDLDHNGTVDFEEFLKLMSKNLKKKDEFEYNLWEAFKVFDKDDNGFISASELKDVLKNMGNKVSEDEVNQMIKMADVVNEDGQVEYAEFVKMMTNTQ